MRDIGSYRRKKMSACTGFVSSVHVTLKRNGQCVKNFLAVPLVCLKPLQEFGRQARYFAAFAVHQRDMTKAGLAGKGVDEHRQGIV